MIPPNVRGLQRENALDAALGHCAVEKLAASPGFLLKKIGYDAILFWTLGDTPAKSLIVSMLQLPLVALFVAFLLSGRYGGDAGVVLLCASLIACVYFAQLPTIAIARYSVVLVPAMLIVCLLYTSPSPRD